MDKCFKALGRFKVTLDAADGLIKTGAPLAKEGSPRAADYITAGATAYQAAMTCYFDWKALEKVGE